MALPSNILDAIVARLTTLLGGSAVAVRAHDGNLTGDALANVTIPSPGILVMCSDLPVVGYEFEPPVASARFVALCMAKQGTSTLSKGDIAMNLAALVASHVSREMWSGTAFRAATRIQSANLTNYLSLDKSTALWAVSWTQEIELTAADTSGLINQLSQINIDIFQGEEEDPGTQIEIQFP